MEYLRLYLDDGRIGCGWRAYVLIATGRKWARLVDPTRGIKLKLPIHDLRHAQSIERPRWHRIARQLRKAGRRDLARAVLR